MIGIAGLRPRGDQLRLFGAGLGIVICLLLGEFLSVKYDVDVLKYLPSRGVLVFYICAIGICAVISYYLLRFIMGGNKVDNLISKTVEQIARIYQRAR